MYIKYLSTWLSENFNMFYLVIKKKQGNFSIVIHRYINLSMNNVLMQILKIK
jgi:hypothetical protein